MAAPAPARLPAPPADGSRKWWAGVILATVLNIGGWLYSYGQLTQEVRDLGHEVQELRQDVRQLHVR
jgi:hypothetical protein